MRAEQRKRPLIQTLKQPARVRTGLRTAAVFLKHILCGIWPASHAHFPGHLARQLRGALQVVRRAAGHAALARVQRLRRAPGQQNADAVFKIAARIHRLFRRNRQIVPRRAVCGRHDAHPANAILRRKKPRNHRVPGLVQRDQPPFLLAHSNAPLAARNQRQVRRFDIRFADSFRPPPRRSDGGLVQKIFKRRARKQHRARGEVGQIHVRVHRLSARVKPENLFPRVPVRHGHLDAAVKPSRPQKRRVEHLRAVRRADDDHALRRPEAGHLAQQRVQRLVALVRRVRAAQAPQRIDFVDKNHTFSQPARLFKRIAHPARADAHVHLHKV